MTHAELVERAYRWLRRTWHCGVAFAEISTYANSIPDAIGFEGRHIAHCHDGERNWPIPIRSVLVECKISRSDWRRDRKKWSHRLDRLPGQIRYYLTPPGLLRPDEIDDPWGLAECHERQIRIIKPAIVLNREDATAMSEEMIILRSACRRHAIGVDFDDKTGRFTPLDSLSKPDYDRMKHDPDHHRQLLLKVIR